MNEYEISPEELFFLGALLQAKYIDYAYIAAMDDIQDQGCQSTQEHDRSGENHHVSSSSLSFRPLPDSPVVIAESELPYVFVFPAFIFRFGDLSPVCPHPVRPGLHHPVKELPSGSQEERNAFPFPAVSQQEDPADHHSQDEEAPQPCGAAADIKQDQQQEYAQHQGCYDIFPHVGSSVRLYVVLRLTGSAYHGPDGQKRTGSANYGPVFFFFF